ncbi:hypothetical protein BDN72DRAFT_835704 [Pluteus cervinus]|uniref:Uncharacterized protein n=1 Tax=Pluteus cervinus TaxID=181527 RepID=A0ACD3B464_9AGAR|nr:hypothetical protein BDN72DRAFT_835704 [Pluteus cervinus]
MPTDHISSLPVELWGLILGYISDLQLRELVYLHPVFCHFARAIIWKKVKLCSLEEQQRDRVLQLLRYPTLTSFVREIEIVRPHQHHLGQRDRSHWGLEMDRMYHEISRTSWLEPAKLVQQVLLGPRKIIHLSTALLKEVQGINHIVINFLCHTSVCPCYQEDYEPLLSAIGTLNPTIRFLKLSLQLRDLPLFAKCMPAAAPGLQDLRTCVLYVLAPGKGTISDTKYINSLSSFLEPVRKSLCSLAIIVPVFPPGLSLIPHLESLSFPNLTRLHLSIPSRMWSHRHASNLQTLLSHSKRLRVLVLTYISMGDFPSLWSSDTSPTRLPPLESLHIEVMDTTGSYSAQLATALLRPFENSLTTLSLLGRSLTYDEVRVLLHDLSRNRDKPILRKLRLAVSRLTPQLMDLFANRLESLQYLDLSYDETFSSNDAIIRDEREFLNIMSNKRYYRWRLKQIYAHKPSISTNGWVRADPASVPVVLRRCVPRAQLTGAVDWSEFSEPSS